MHNCLKFSCCVTAEPCCQNCGFSCCLPNMCCKRNRLTIHPANGHDTVGEIVHTYPGCSKYVTWQAIVPCTFFTDAVVLIRPCLQSTFMQPPPISVCWMCSISSCACVSRMLDLYCFPSEHYYQHPFPMLHDPCCAHLSVIMPSSRQAHNYWCYCKFCLAAGPAAQLAATSLFPFHLLPRQTRRQF